MISAFGWAPTGLLLLCLGALAGALLTKLATPLFAGPNALLRRLEPASRFHLLAALASLPVLGALALFLIAFGPSLLHAAGIVADHCGRHIHHQGLHLCFLHYPPPQISASLLALTLLAMAGPSWKGTRTLAALRSSYGQTGALFSLATYDKTRRVYVVDSQQPFALSAGIFRPRILIASSLVKTLSPEQLAAVIAHERAHQRRRDGLLLSLIYPALALHIPAVANRLRNALHLAMEQACDEEAATAVKSRLTVAEALLAVERAHQNAPSRIPALLPGLHFESHPLEARVTGLLRNSWARPAWPILGTTAVALAVALIIKLPWLHHVLEHALALFL